MEIDLRDCIAPDFRQLHHDVQKHRATIFDLIGGRGSTKSTFVSIEIALLMQQYADLHAVCYRKWASELETSVYDQIRWSISKMNLDPYWKITRSPLRITRLSTGQTILFKGLDKAEKSKSIKVPFGYTGILWFEEFDEFDGAEEIRKVQQSVLRGGDKFWVFKSMNPPRSNANWANSYIDDEKTRKDTIVSKTDYLSVPKDWLGQAFIDDANFLKETNPKAYEHEYLGEIVGNGTEFFDNLEIRQITDEEISHFDRIYMGIDWGWYPDPFHWGKMHFDAARRTLYIFDELRRNKTSNREIADILIEDKGVEEYTDLITCDSAEKKSTADLRAFGINARDAEKGPNSVKEGSKWLQSLLKIVIDPVRCPYTAEEFRKAEYDITKAGDVLNVMPDRDNHSIDMTRYAMERVWKRRGK